MNHDQVQGQGQGLEGKAKVVTGKNVGSMSLEVNGKVHYSVEKIQAAYDDFKDNYKKKQVS